MITNKTNNSFLLDKTYLDCIDEAGNCFILYTATLKFLFFNIRYSAFIFSDQNNKVTERSSFTNSSIIDNNSVLSFSNKNIGISGNWQSSQYPVTSLLYSKSNGIVNWNCHHPLAECTVNYKGRTFHGLGYAENILLTIKPWQLPIDELRWGRFLAPGIAITWIQWVGKNPVNKIYLNGKEWNDPQYSFEAITFNKGKNKLVFSNSSSVRQLKFANHFSKAPFLKLFIPKGILNSVESKYKAATLFTDVSGAIHHGWSIFEIIQWEH
ncbi:MAG: hypothetical protein IPP72_15160 [Chitinophagaceae bacterium]|nr:hypothetical protein [Chitinophagaceae bacterium]